MALKDAGGPSGYLYNLKTYLKENHCDQICFYSDIVSNIETEVEPTSNKQSFKERLKKNTWIKTIFYIGWFYFQKEPLNDNDLKILSEYDYVHVHNVSTFLRSFRDYKGKTKIILTSHMPEPCIDETMSLCGHPKLLKRLPFIRNYFIRKEICAFKKTDRIMFPVENALEVYTNNSRIYRESFKSLKSKMFFVPTSILDLKCSGRKANLLESYNIPNETLKICFIGRHNHVKGYDQLKLIAEKCWKKYQDVTFIIGGKESPMRGLNDGRWIEMGWIQTQELLQEVDVFILPNKDTYFDLILLEVLRQGVPCLISNTGGNKFFAGCGVEGIQIYDYSNLDSAINTISYFYEKKREGALYEMTNDIKEYFRTHFTPNIYVSNYVQTLSLLTDEDSTN